MKRTIKYMGLALVLAATSVACNKNAEPVFDDKDAFVAFDKTEYSVAEDYTSQNEDATFKIPVTLASVKGLEQTVRFEILADPEKTTAVAETNYELVTSSGTLSFDAEHRTSYIEIKTKTDGTFTGDLKIAIQIFGNDEIGVGTENVCTVTINDIDHPNGFLFGNYKMTATPYGASAPVTWDMSVFKDPKDINVVWFYNLMGNSSWARDEIVYYGVVSNDKTTINLPFGQESEYLYQKEIPVTLLGLDSDLYGHDQGAIDIKVTTTGGKVTLDFGTEYGLWFYIEGAGSIGTYIAGPGITAVQQ